MELSALLERHYFQVFTAADGVEALEVLAQHKDIQLIITDYNMPNMDGIEFTSKVRSSYSRNELAIIGVSASTDTTTTIRFLKSGANDFITRPFLHEELYCRISQNIDAVRSFSRLSDAVDRDSLTGMYNRAYLLKSGSKLFENAMRKNIRLMAVMIDIDQFKQITKDHGRQTGDRAVQHIAAKLDRLLRKTDVVSRFSYSEFCLLCVNADAEHDEQQLLNNLRDVIQYSPLHDSDTLSIPLTISMGYCTEPGDSLEDMIDNAYAALQKAQQQGRNQIAWYDPFKDEKVNAS
jgi:diguanylate cyclase (GGDEF)-like protein